jgi:CheY-like chemotaxis protein
VLRTVFLVHWNEAEAAVLADGLRRMGWTVDVEAKDGAEAYRRIRSSPPAALVVYLTRLPSHGIKTAAALQMNALTRTIPTIIVGGSEDAVDKARAKLPGATFIAPDGLQGALQRLTSAAA